MRAEINARQTVAALLPRGGVGAEIGVFRAGFSRVILAEAQPRRLFLVDPWRNSPRPEHARSLYAQGGANDMEAIHAEVVRAFAAPPHADRVKVVRSSSADWLSAQPEGSLDFVYIDGDHSLAAVREDIALSVRAVRPGGMIALDDYSLGQWWGDGVVRAVHEALASLPLLIQFCADGQVALRRR